MKKFTALILMLCLSIGLTSVGCGPKPVDKPKDPVKPAVPADPKVGEGDVPPAVDTPPAVAPDVPSKEGDSK